MAADEVKAVRLPALVIVPALTKLLTAATFKLPALAIKPLLTKLLTLKFKPKLVARLENPLRAPWGNTEVKIAFVWLLNWLALIVAEVTFETDDMA